MWGYYDYQDDLIPQWQIGGIAGDVSGEDPAAGSGRQRNWGSALQTFGAALMDASLAMQGRQGSNLSQLQTNRLRRRKLSLEAAEQKREQSRLDEIKKIMAGAVRGPEAVPPTVAPVAQIPVAQPASPPAAVAPIPGDIQTPDAGLPQVDEFGQPYPDITVSPTGAPGMGNFPGHGAPPGAPGAPVTAPAPVGMADIVARRNAQADQAARAAMQLGARGETQGATLMLRRAENLRKIPFSVYAQMSGPEQDLFRQFQRAQSGGTTIGSTEIINKLGNEIAALPEQTLRDNALAMGEQYRKASPLGRSMVQGAEALKNLLVTQGTETGAWSPPLMEAARWLGGDAFLSMFGFDEGQLAQMELFNSGTSDIILDRLQKFEGAITNEEREFIERTSVGLGKDPVANYVLLETMRRAGVRMQNKQHAFAAYLAKPGVRGGAGFEDWFLNDPEARQWNPWAGQSSTDMEEVLEEAREWAQQSEIQRRGLRPLTRNRLGQ